MWLGSFRVCLPANLFNSSMIKISTIFFKITLDKREPGLTAKDIEVMGRATGEMVVSGQVRVLNKAGNNGAEWRG